MLLFTYGCATYEEKLQHFDKFYYQQGDVQKAFDFSKNLHKNALLWEIQSGLSAYMAGKYEDSIKKLNEAESKFNQNHMQNIFQSALTNTGATLLNDNVKTYQGNLYEGVFINYYKALDALALGDNAKARIEFNRANDRQRRAKQYYQKEIQKTIQENIKNTEKETKSSSMIDKNTSQDKINSILDTQYSNLKKFKGYSGFINPTISYVSGLYFSLQGDHKGIDLLKESYGINQSQIIGEDILLFQKQNPFKKHTWIIIEDGKNATKKEFSIKLPLFLLSDEVYYFGLALPQLEDGVDFYQNFTLQGIHSKTFDQISLTDNIIANEFSKQLPYILTRSIISAIYKTSLQKILNNQLGSFAGFLGALFSATTTSADTRITTVFPNKVWLMRIDNKVGNFFIDADKKNIFEFDIIDCDSKNPLLENEHKICKNTNNLIYIRTTKNNIIYKLLIGEKE
ncbi:hypothetical protein BKH44_00390 [Helicobacter sp. 13S00477-4]|nr:hypothetical protein BKH44_00390 [Helicobacter sp. 13S00477-4]